MILSARRTLLDWANVCNDRRMSEQPELLMYLEFDLADRMRKTLRATGISVQEMADYLDVTRGTISTWINGRIAPSTQTLRLWALRTGAPYAWLKDGVNEGSPAPTGTGLPQGVRAKGFEPPTFCSVVWLFPQDALELAA